MRIEYTVLLLTFVLCFVIGCKSTKQTDDEEVILPTLGIKDPTTRVETALKEQQSKPTKSKTSAALASLQQKTKQETLALPLQKAQAGTQNPPPSTHTRLQEQPTSLPSKEALPPPKKLAKQDRPEKAPQKQEMVPQEPKEFREILNYYQPKGSSSTVQYRKWLIQQFSQLSYSDKNLVRQNKASLPLLLLPNIPITKRVLAEHGERAWRFLSMLEYNSTTLETFSGAIERFGDIVLDIAEQYGLGVALLFVKRGEDPKGCLPYLLKKMVDAFTKENKETATAQAAALWTRNYETLLEHVREEKPCRVLERAVEILEGFEETLRIAAMDSSETIRFLLEKDGEEEIGVQLFRQNGPLAPSVFYHFYENENATIKKAALHLIQSQKEKGLYLLARYNELPAWKKLLSRPRLNSSHEASLLPYLANKIFLADEPTKKIEELSQQGYLEILDKRIPPSTLTEALDWIPGYKLATNLYEANVRGHKKSMKDYILASISLIPKAKVAGKAVQYSFKGSKLLLKVTRKKKERPHNLKKYFHTIFQKTPNFSLITHNIKHADILGFYRKNQVHYKKIIAALLYKVLEQSSRSSTKRSPLYRGYFRHFVYLSRHVHETTLAEMFHASLPLAKLVRLRLRALPKQLSQRPWSSLITKQLEKKMKRQIANALSEEVYELFGKLP